MTSEFQTNSSDPIPTLGVLELSSIASGLRVCDAMLKKAEVRILRATPAGCGKFLILVTGYEADLLEALEEGKGLAPSFLVSWTYLPNLHPQVLEVLRRRRTVAPELDALGILESRHLAALIRSADSAVKTAEVRLLELSFDMDLGGKGYFTLTGALGDVEAALDASQALLEAENAFVNREIMARPHEGLDPLVKGGMEKTCF